MRHPRKRTLLMVLLLLTGGALINVAVAWAFAVWIKASDSPEIQTIDHAASFALYVRDNPFSFDYEPTLMVHSVENPGEVKLYQWRETGICLVHVHGKTAEKGPRNIATMIVESSGWPFLTLRGEFWRAFGSMPVKTRTVHAVLSSAFGIKPPNDVVSFMIGGRLVPMEPLWPGFAINTIFYAAILYLPFAGFRFARRRIRARRGQCPACAYPVGASTVCTECGRALPLSLRERVRVRVSCNEAVGAERS